MELCDFSWELAIDILSIIYEYQIKNRKCSEEDILVYTDKTRSYLFKTLNYLIELRCIVNDNDSYTINSEYYKKIDGSRDSLSYPIKESLISYKPFSEYIYYISRGKSPDEAVRLVKTLYSLKDANATISKIFDKWVKFANVQLSVKSKSIGITPQLASNESIRNLQDALDNKALALRYIKEELGDLYIQVSPDVINDLCSALQNINIDTSESINDTGRALEDFLRIDLKSGLDLSKCAGIAQIAAEFNRFEKYPNKLNNVVSGLANIRSMGKAHGVDKDLNQRWVITKSSAAIYIITVLAIIKSYLKYIKTGIAEF